MIFLTAKSAKECTQKTQKKCIVQKMEMHSSATFACISLAAFALKEVRLYSVCVFCVHSFALFALDTIVAKHQRRLRRARFPYNLYPIPLYP